MKKENGVTLVSLTIYVIVSAAVVLILSFLNANFFSRMSDLTNKTNVTNEYSKFCSSFIRDLKASESVAEYNKSEIKFSNGAVYEIRKLQSSNDAYAIYRNSIKVCENIKAEWIKLYNNDEEEGEEYARSPYFDYDHLENTVTVALFFSKPQTNNYEFDMQQVFKVGQ